MFYSWQERHWIKNLTRSSEVFHRNVDDQRKFQEFPKRSSELPALDESKWSTMDREFGVEKQFWSMNLFQLFDSFPKSEWHRDSMFLNKSWKRSFIELRTTVRVLFKNNFLVSSRARTQVHVLVLVLALVSSPTESECNVFQMDSIDFWHLSEKFSTKVESIFS